MRFLVVLILLACVGGALGWRQCGAPSDRVVKVEELEVKSALKGDQHWVRVIVRGTSSRVVPAAARVEPMARMGAIQIPLDHTTLKHPLGPGPVEYVYEKLFEAPSGITVHVKLSVMDGNDEVLCLRDIEIKL